MQKSEEIEDPRVQRTRKLLQQAFMELTVEKGFEALTVRDITQRAMMNRSTFYRHYLDKYDLLEQYMDELYVMFQGRGGVAELKPHEAPSNLVDLLKHIQQFADFYRVMLTAKTDHFFEQRFHQKMEKRFFSCFDGTISDHDIAAIDLSYNVLLNAGRSAIVWWLAQEYPYPPEQFAHWLNQFIYDTYVSSRKQKG
jgi:AcrR family transcriptional regulator